MYFIGDLANFAHFEQFFNLYIDDTMKCTKWK